MRGKNPADIINISVFIPSDADVVLPGLCLSESSDLSDLNFCTHLQTVLNPKEQLGSISCKPVKISDTLLTRKLSILIIANISYRRSVNATSVKSYFVVTSQNMTSRHTGIFK